MCRTSHSRRYHHTHNTLSYQPLLLHSVKFHILSLNRRLFYIPLNMRYITAIVLASAAGLVTANPLTRRADWTKFPKNTVFDIILEKSKVTLDQLKDFKYGTVIDIDLYDNISNGQTTIQDLKKAGKIVVCYFSAGSREDWRDDAKLWNPSDYGKVLKKSDKEDWKGENWANVKSDNVRKIMKARIELAAKSGCQAVDPDNVDGFVSLF